MTEYCWCLTGDDFIHGVFGSQDDAATDALNYLGRDRIPAKITVGEVKRPWAPDIAAMAVQLDDILEKMEELLCDNPTEDEAFYPKKNARIELETMVRNWTVRNIHVDEKVWWMDKDSREDMTISLEDPGPRFFGQLPDFQ